MSTATAHTIFWGLFAAIAAVCLSAIFDSPFPLFATGLGLVLRIVHQYGNWAADKRQEAIEWNLMMEREFLGEYKPKHLITKQNELL